MGLQWDSKVNTTIQRSVPEQAGNLRLFDTFAKNTKSNSGALRQLVTEIKRSSNLAYDEDHSNHLLCNVLWSAVKAHDWALHAQSKTKTDDTFTKAFGAFMDLIQKYKSQ